MNSNIRGKLHEILWTVLIVFCVLGIFYPPIGLIAIICMVAPAIYGFFKNTRGWCGTYCPRGSLNDIVLKKISLNKNIPKPIKTNIFRTFVLILIFGLFILQIILAPKTLQGIGTVFVRMIIITTLITMILGVIYKPRTWCTFCPMGTLASLVILFKKQKENDTYIIFDKDQCINCNRCSKNCPMEIDVLSYKDEGYVNSSDCIRCNTCISICPKDALSEDRLYLYTK